MSHVTEELELEASCLEVTQMAMSSRRPQVRMSGIRMIAPPTLTLNSHVRDMISFKPSVTGDSPIQLLSATSQYTQQEEGKTNQPFPNRASWMPGATHAAWSTTAAKDASCHLAAFG